MPPSLPHLSGTEEVRALEKLGFTAARQKGSHLVWLPRLFFFNFQLAHLRIPEFKNELRQRREINPVSTKLACFIRAKLNHQWLFSVTSLNIARLNPMKYLNICY